MSDSVLNIWDGTVEIKEHRISISDSIFLESILYEVLKDYPNTRFVNSSYNIKYLCYRILAIYRIKSAIDGYDEYYVIEKFDGETILIRLESLKDIIYYEKDDCIINLVDDSSNKWKLTHSGKNYSSKITSNIHIVSDYSKELKSYNPNIGAITKQLVSSLLDNRYVTDRNKAYQFEYNKWYDRVCCATINSNITAEQLKSTYSKLKMIGLQCSIVDIHTMIAYDENKNKTMIYTMQSNIDEIYRKRKYYNR